MNFKHKVKKKYAYIQTGKLEEIQSKKAICKEMNRPFFSILFQSNGMIQ